MSSPPQTEMPIGTFQRGVMPLLLGAVAAALLAVAWVAATAATDLTFHFHPLLIAGAPAVIARALAGTPRPTREATAAALLGAAAVLIAWITLEIGGIAPTATFLDDQPGGVRGEVVLFGGIGAVAAAIWARRS